MAPWSTRLYHPLPDPHQEYPLALPPLGLVPKRIMGLSLPQQNYVPWNTWVWLPTEYLGESCPWCPTTQKQRSGATPTQLLPGPVLLTLCQSIPRYYLVCTIPFGQYPQPPRLNGCLDSSSYCLPTTASATLLASLHATNKRGDCWLRAYSLTYCCGYGMQAIGVVACRLAPDSPPACMMLRSSTSYITRLDSVATTRWQDCSSFIDPRCDSYAKVWLHVCMSCVGQYRCMFC